MDFGTLELDAGQAAFVADVRRLLRSHLPAADGAETRRIVPFDERFHRALGARGWLLPERSTAEGGAGLDPVRCFLLEHECARAGAPLLLRTITRMVLPAIERFGDRGLVAELLPQVAAGTARFCLGYTEPDCGSDIAAARTSAVRDGDDWIVDGSKLYTSEAHNATHCFLLARTDRASPRHAGLTMFLVPLASAGIEIGPIHTIGEERTNVVYYTGVRVADRHRIGAPGNGWKVLLGPLSAEHGTHGGDGGGLGALSAVGEAPIQMLRDALAAARSWAAQHRCADGSAPLDDPTVRARLAAVAIALSVILIVATLIIVVLVERLVGVARAVGQ